MSDPARRPFHLLAKPTGAVCNLDCTYCFFLSKDALYPGERTRMGADTLRAYLTQMISAQPDGPVNVAWQGGEPTLMGIDFYREAFAIVDEVARPSQVIEHTIQTNGTLVDDTWARLFADRQVLVGLSIDGRPDDHDRFRVWKDGRGSYADVRRAWDLLRGSGVECNVLCSLSAANVDHPLETYRHLRDDLGARHIQFIPIVERATTANIEVAEGRLGHRTRKATNSLHATGRSRHVPIDIRTTVRGLPVRGVRRVGRSRRRRGLRATVRRHPGSPFRPAQSVRARPHVRVRPGPRAQR